MQGIFIYNNEYCVYPEEGVIICEKTGNEIATGKEKAVLNINGKKSIVKKLRVVYEAVHGPSKTGTVFIAQNGDFTDARISNIEKLERPDYFKRKKQDWTMKVKLTKDEWQGIKKDYSTGQYSQRDLAFKYNCSMSTVHNVVKGLYYYD